MTIAWPRAILVKAESDRCSEGVADGVVVLADSGSKEQGTEEKCFGHFLKLE